MNTSYLKPLYLKILLGLVFVVSTSNLYALTYYSRDGSSTDYWTDGDSWSLVGLNGASANATPGINDDVVIAGYRTIVVNNATPQCKTLTIGGVSNGTLSYTYGSNGGVFTIADDVTINSNGTFTTTGSARTQTMNIGGNVVNDGTFNTYTGNNNYLNVVFNGTDQSISGNGTYYWYELQVANGSYVTNYSTSEIVIRTDIFVYGTLDLTSGSSINRYAASGNTFRLDGTLRVGGSSGGVSGSNVPAYFTTYTLGASSTVEFYYDGVQTVPARTYANLILSGSGAKVTTSVNVNSTLSIEGTASAGNAITYGNAATLQYKGLSDFTVSTNELPINFPGSGGIVIDQGLHTVTLNHTVTNAGNIWVKSGTFDLQDKTLDRSSLGGSLTVDDASFLFIGGLDNFPSNYSTHLIDCNSTIKYSGGDQTVANLNSSQIYGNLILSGTGTKTLQSSMSQICKDLTINATVSAVTGLTIGGNLSIESEGAFSAGSYTHFVNGDFSNLGLLVDAGSTFSFSGTLAQSIGTSNFNNLIFSNAGIKTASGELTVNGDLTINSNFSGGNALTHTLSGDFVNDGTYTAGTGTLIMDGLSQQTIGGTQNINFNNLVCNSIVRIENSYVICQNLNINNSAVVNLPVGVYFQVDNLTNSSGPSGLILESSVTEPNPSLVFNNTISNPVEGSVSLSSKANFAGSFNNWQFIGIPVNKIPKSYGPLSGSYMRQFNESTVISGSVPSPWLSVDDTIQSFTGYMITQDNPRSIPFEGFLNNQSKTFNLQYTTGATFAGLNLLANSFTAAVNIGDLEFDNDMIKEIYLFNTGYRNSTQDPTSESGENSGQYLVVPQATAGTLGLPSQISSMQAFFVQATASSQSFTIPYSATEQQTVILRAPKLYSSEDDLVGTKLTLWSEHTLDHLWLFSHPDCSSSFDNGYDGNKFMNGSGSANLFVSADSRDYQVYTTNNIDETLIEFVPGASDTVYKISAVHNQIIEMYLEGLFLVDLLEDKVVNISEDSASYTFTAYPDDAISARFKLVVEDPTSIEPVESSNATIKLISASGKLILMAGNNEIHSVVVFDISGKMLYSEKLSDVNSVVLNTKLAPGTYIVKCETQNGYITEKVIL